MLVGILQLSDSLKYVFEFLTKNRIIYMDDNYKFRIDYDSSVYQVLGEF